MANIVMNERPCCHNVWDNVRTKKGYLFLRCRMCESQWKADVNTMSARCEAFISPRGCRFGPKCTKLHIHPKKASLVQRVANHGEDVLERVNQRDAIARVHGAEQLRTTNSPKVLAPESRAPEPECAAAAAVVPSPVDRVVQYVAPVGYTLQPLMQPQARQVQQPQLMFVPAPPVQQNMQQVFFVQPQPVFLVQPPP
eukprot:TRINITY_DN10557_c1_g1_i1.p2 TRINITY_DN10557_c1_g1~~TRINITY_DN10557_c1_g1_i1.p2  ORF type:complete len:197 (+),score=20.99 TRINITY_DN10557_c1_g1_i1:58-648(+)